MAQLDLFSSGKKQEKVEGKEAEINNLSDKENINIEAIKVDVMPEATSAVQGVINKDDVEEEVFDNIEKPIKDDAVVFADARIRIKLKHLQKEQEVDVQPTGKNAHKIMADPVEDIKEKNLKIIQKRGRKSLKEIDAEVDLIEIPEDDILFRKQYYSISEVAGWFKVNTSLLRFWETEFDILKPRKNRKGDRMFRPEDVKNLQLIYHLLRDRKYTIDGAKDYIKGNKKKADTQLQLTQSLQKFKSFLLELKANLQ